LNTPPPDLTTDHIASAVAAHWDIGVEHLEYAALGFGSHHWIATDGDGVRWFITVDELEYKPWLAADADAAFTLLTSCYELPRTLGSIGFTFVRAPLNDRTGAVIQRVGDRFALSVYAWVEGRGHRFGDFDDDHERDEVLRRLARLHAVTDAVREFPMVERFAIPERSQLDRALSFDDAMWQDGPLSVPARTAIADNAVELRHALDAYDDLVRRADATDFVITHGEPHAANWIIAADGPVLIDWDTPMLAPRERDIARVIGGDIDDADAYGTPLDRDLLLLYQLWWDLKDVACYVDILCEPHADTEDTRKMLVGLERSARFSESFPGLLD